MKLTSITSFSSPAPLCFLFCASPSSLFPLLPFLRLLVCSFASFLVFPFLLLRFRLLALLLFQTSPFSTSLPFFLFALGPLRPQPPSPFLPNLRNHLLLLLNRFSLSLLLRFFLVSPSSFHFSSFSRICSPFPLPNFSFISFVSSLLTNSTSLQLSSNKLYPFLIRFFLTLSFMHKFHLGGVKNDHFLKQIPEGVWKKISKTWKLGVQKTWFWPLQKHPKTGKMWQPSQGGKKVVTYIRGHFWKISGGIFFSGHLDPPKKYPSSA